MTSENQIRANQLNAQKSTGPKTPEGKAAVSLNALQHGLRCRRAVLLSENREEFDQLCADLHDEWQPQTSTEMHYVQTMAVSRWKLDRMEAKDSAFTGIENQDLVSRIWRREDALERSHDRALDNLQRLQKARAGIKAGPKTTQQPKETAHPPAPKPAQPETVMRPSNSGPQPVAPAAPVPPAAPPRAS